VNPPKGDLRCLGRDIADLDPLLGVGFFFFLDGGVDFNVRPGVGSANAWKGEDARHPASP
jgi:hypothetical protein